MERLRKTPCQQMNGYFFLFDHKIFTHTHIYSLKSTEDDDDGGEETANINSHFVERQV